MTRSVENINMTKRRMKRVVNNSFSIILGPDINKQTSKEQLQDSHKEMY